MTDHHSEAPDEGPRFVYSARLESNGSEKWTHIEIVIPEGFNWTKDLPKLMREVRNAYKLFFTESEA